MPLHTHPLSTLGTNPHAFVAVPRQRSDSKSAQDCFEVDLLRGNQPLLTAIGTTGLSVASVSQEEAEARTRDI